MGLTLYICLAGLPLGIQGIELQVQVMFGRFAGVDGAAGQFAWAVHRAGTPGLRCRFSGPTLLDGPGPAFCSLSGHPEAEKPGAIAACPGDAPGYGGQTGIVPVPPPKPRPGDNHGMALALVFPDDFGAGLQSARLRRPSGLPLA